MVIFALLGVNLISAIILAFEGDRRHAPELNILASAATFAVSVALALRVYEEGPFITGGGFFFVDAFNVYLCVLTAFVSMTTAVFSRESMAHERKHGKGGHNGMRFYHAM